MIRKYPGFTQQQLDYLDELYPEQCPSISAPDRLIWFNVGCRHVVKTLLAKHQEQLRHSAEDYREVKI